MPDLFTKAKLNNKIVKVHHIKDNWFDVGTKEDFKSLKINVESYRCLKRYFHTL